MTTHSLAHLRALLAKATPGPWRFHAPINGVTAKRGKFDVVYAQPYEGGGLSRHEDGELIAAAVNALPGLLARLELAELVVEAARIVFDTWTDPNHWTPLDHAIDALGQMLPGDDGPA
jgi:hypothetical protein